MTSNTTAPETSVPTFGLTLPDAHNHGRKSTTTEANCHTESSESYLDHDNNNNTLHVASSTKHDHSSFPTLEPPSPAKSRLSFTSSRPSTGVDPSNPLSPFYTHPPCSFEREEVKTAARRDSNAGGPIYEARTLDVDSKTTLKAFSNISITQVTPQRTQDCPMWPSQQEIQRREKESERVRKQNRYCASFTTWFSTKVSKRMKIMLGIATFIVVLGIAITLGLVISKKENTGYYQSSASPNKPIGGS